MTTWKMEIRTSDTSTCIVAEREYLQSKVEEWKAVPNAGIIDIAGMEDNAKREGMEVSIRAEEIKIMIVYEI